MKNNKAYQCERTCCKFIATGSFSDIFGVSTQEHMDQTIAQFCIGLITHWKIHPGLFIHNALVVREGIKTGFSVICTHAAFSYAAESHVGGCKMNDTVIDTATAKAAAGGDSSDIFFMCLSI